MFGRNAEWLDTFGDAPAQGTHMFSEEGFGAGKAMTTTPLTTTTQA